MNERLGVWRGLRYITVRSFVVAIVLFALVLLSMWAGLTMPSSSTAESQTRVPEDWPPFEAVLTETTPPSDGALGKEVTWKITYRSISDWEMDVVSGRTLGDASLPEGGRLEAHPLPGTKMIMQGRELTRIDPDGKSSVLHEGDSAPNGWLQPRYGSWTARRDGDGWQVERADGPQHESARLNSYGIPTSYQYTDDDTVRFKASLQEFARLEG